jgi:hypothetical protein
MRDPNRIEPLLALLREYWQKHPDMRLGQIVKNAYDACWEGADSRASLFQTEDYLLEAGLRKLAIRGTK